MKYAAGGFPRTRGQLPADILILRYQLERALKQSRLMDLDRLRSSAAARFGPRGLR